MNAFRRFSDIINALLQPVAGAHFRYRPLLQAPNAERLSQHLRQPGEYAKTKNPAR